VESLTGKLNKQ